MIDTLFSVAIGLVVLGIAAALVSMIRAGTAAQRLVALELLLTLTVCAIAIRAASTNEDLFLDILLVVSLVGFSATVVVSGFLRTRED